MFYLNFICNDMVPIVNLKDIDLDEILKWGLWWLCPNERGRERSILTFLLDDLDRVRTNPTLTFDCMTLFNFNSDSLANVIRYILPLIFIPKFTAASRGRRSQICSAVGRRRKSYWRNKKTRGIISTATRNWKIKENVIFKWNFYRG